MFRTEIHRKPGFFKSLPFIGGLTIIGLIIFQLALWTGILIGAVFVVKTAWSWF